MSRSNTKEAKERLRALHENLQHRASGAQWEVQDELTHILGLLGEDVDEGVEDPVLESHLTPTQVKQVRKQKEAGQFAGPETNP